MTEKEARNVEEQAADEQSDRNRAINKAHLAKEQLIQNRAKEKEIKRTEKKAVDDTAQLARYQSIRNADLARELLIEKGQAARRLEDK